MSLPWVVTIGLLWFTVIVTLLLVLGLLRRMGAVLERAESVVLSASGGRPREGLQPGAAIGGFVGLDASGRRVTSDELLRGTPFVVLFLKKSCAPCEQLALDLRSEAPIGRAELLVVLPDTKESKELDLEAYVPVIYDGSSVSSAFETTITPHAFLINRDGIVLENEIGASFQSVSEMVSRLEAPTRERRLNRDRVNDRPNERVPERLNDRSAV